jgi:cyanate lyase
MVSFVGFWVYRDSVHEAHYAERIFKILGFKNPKIVDLAPFSLSKENNYSAPRQHYIFRLRKALAFYGSLSKAPASDVKAAPQTTAKTVRKAAGPVAKK